jgi:hypothetical protein
VTALPVPTAPQGTPDALVGTLDCVIARNRRAIAEASLGLGQLARERWKRQRASGTRPTMIHQTEV